MTEKSRTVTKPHLKTIWNVVRVLKTARKRSVPIHPGMIYELMKAPDEDVATALRALYAGGMVDVAWYSTEIATATSQPHIDITGVNGKIMLLLTKGPYSESSIAWNLRLPLWQIHESLCKLEEDGMVTLQKKSFEFVTIHSRLNILKTTILRIFQYGKYQRGYKS